MNQFERLSQSQPLVLLKKSRRAHLSLLSHEYESINASQEVGEALSVIVGTAERTELGAVLRMTDGNDDGEEEIISDGAVDKDILG